MTSHPAVPGALLKGEPKELNIIRADFANTRTYASAHAKSGSYRNINNSTKVKIEGVNSKFEMKIHRRYLNEGIHESLSPSLLLRGE